MENHLVIDLAEIATPEEVARALNAPGDSYFLVQVLPVFGGHRAYLRRYKQTPAKPDTAAMVDDAAALSVVRANKDKSVRTIVEVLGKARIKRGRQWVSDQLTAVCSEDGREEEAVRFVKERPHWTPRDLITELGWVKIKRTTAWVRQRRLELGQKPEGERRQLSADNS